MVLSFFKKTFLFFWEVFKIVAIALVIVVPIRYFVFQPFIVKGSSMKPNFHDGDYLIVDELSYRFREPERGEVMVFEYPKDTSQRFIKRVIGLPGEQVGIKDGKVVVIDRLGNRTVLNELGYLSLVRGAMSDMDFVRLGEDQYFVLGDNRAHSYDSEEWGALKKEFLVGRVLFRAWPAKAMAFIPAPAY